MPWDETNAMEQRVQFIRDWLTRKHYVSALCERYGVSRKTGYKWIERYMSEGPDGLLARGHEARVVHNRTAPEVEQEILALRLRHPTWGAKKLLHVLGDRQPDVHWPHRATVSEILDRNGLIAAKPRRRLIGHPGKPMQEVVLANDCWSIDFKGQFRTGDGVYTYPLTVTDNYSRYLLGVKAMPGTLYECTRGEMTRLFKEYGLPRRIRSDNGSPFAAATLGRLSRLSVWWIKLGIKPELIEPGKPQQNGRHERMHRTLKNETTKPPGANARAQQRKFNQFRQEYNEIRPHEALDMKTPSQVYRPSSTEMPSKLLEPEYPDRFERRLVSGNGGIQWKKNFVNVTSSLIGEYVGLEEIDDGQWDVYYGPMRLGRLHERHMRIEDHLGKLIRRV